MNRYTFVKKIAVPIALLGISVYLEHRGAFEPYAAATFDNFQRVKRILSRKSLDQPTVTIYRFGLSEYLKYLDGEGLSSQSRIVALIHAIACASPAVIGVDWDTGHWNPSVFSPLTQTPNIPIVWARTFDEAKQEEGSVAGGVVLPPMWTAGIGDALSDSDHTIRSYSRWLMTSRGSYEDTFSWALVRSYCEHSTSGDSRCLRLRDCLARRECDPTPLFDFADGSDVVDVFSADVILSHLREGHVSCANLPNGGANAYIRGRIVIIGDATSSDLHYTPFDLVPGYKIVGHAIQTDLEGKHLHAGPRGWRVYVFHILAVCAVILINRKMPPFAALCSNLLGLPFLAVVFSYWAFHSFNHWVNFVPVLGGMLIHELYDQAEQNERLREKVSERRDRPLPQASDSA